MSAHLLTRARARLFKRLERATQFPILVVYAPAGCGKTTVLREFFAARALPHRRVEIAPGQGELLGFMRSFAKCFVDIAPILLPSFMRADGGAACGEQVAEEIEAWVAGHLAGLELTVIVDGIERVTDGRVFGVLSALIDRTSSADGLHWVLVAESVERFPVARWLANDRMDMPIDDVDLAITYDDLVAAVEGARAPITHATLRDIARATGDWPAATALALSDLAKSWIVDPRTVGPRSYAHFAEHAFAARSESEQRFLLETCVYNDFNRDVLDAAGWANVEPILESLRAAGGMLFERGSDVFAYHELFRVYLVQQLQADPGDRYAQVCRAAAAAYERVGRWSAAIEIHIKSQALFLLAKLLSAHGFDLLDRGEAELVQAALDMLGDAEFAAFPVTLAVKASLQSLHGSFDLAEAWFAHAIELAGDSSRRGTIVFRFATDLVRRDRRDAIPLLEAIVADGGHERGLALSLAGLLATAYATDGQMPAATATIERALHLLGDLDDPAVRAKLYFQAGYVAFFSRDFVRAKGFARQAVETAAPARLYDIAARALSILYNVAMDHEDDVVSGRRYLDELAGCSMKAGSRNLLLYATVAQFEIEVLSGNLVESARLEAALQSLEIGYSLLATETLLPAQALRATWSGDFGRAYRLIAPTAEQQITSARRAQRYAEIAVYAAAAGLRAEASAAVSRALEITFGHDPAEAAVAFARAYIALALNLLGRHRRAAQVRSTLDRSPALTPRFSVLRDAIVSISERCENGRYATDVWNTLERLEACDFGGIRRLIEALPLPDNVREPRAPRNPRDAVLAASVADVD